ncbi:PspC domain-containing protein [Microbacterium sp. No. 7]|uniref:PspC domain-containing protein n=1 Tax=Microbacterium sp. No. 7 TaxID=1714373 RepID=UPI0006CFC9B3|nr:PspC domain-containing protein [Microbacterium sp. No. 7]ALJ19156.1 hypothetical protein AOA12_04255 [Microbacterium sp. No. 7]
MTIARPTTDAGSPRHGAPPAPGPATSPGAPAPRRSDGFFAWIADRGIVRADGWLSGVCGGIAARLRIDPLIVRGVFVVAALFGLPMFFVYAIAWALLPDPDGRILLRSALHGRFEPALLGVAGTMALGLVPVGGFFFVWLPMLGFSPSSGTWAVLAFLAVVGGIAAIALLLFLIVRATRRTPGPSDPRQASAAPAGPVPPAPGSGPAADEVDAGALAAASTSPLLLADDAAPAASEPDAPPADASSDDLAAWRAQHAAWKEQEQEWRRRQQDADRLAREQARAERREQSAAFSAAAAEHRRVRRLTNPRTSAAYVAVVVGVAIVAGALTALFERLDLAIAVGLFTAAFIVAIGMIAAGIARRRSGFLAFMAGLLLVAGAVATVVPVAQSLNVWGYGLSNHAEQAYPAHAPLRQPWGPLWILVDDTGDDGSWHIVKQDGSTSVSVDAGAEVVLDITTRNAWVGVVVANVDGEQQHWFVGDLDGITTTRLPDGRVRYTGTLGRDDAPITTTQSIVLEQTSGYIDISLWPPDDEAATYHEGGSAGIRPRPVATPSAAVDENEGGVR